MITYFLWFKTLHLFSVILWAGSMVLLPWLFVMLAKSNGNPDKELLLLGIIRHLIKRVINAAMIASYLTGGGLIWVLTQTGGLVQGWLHVKITLVLILTACHGIQARSLRKMLKAGDPPKSACFYKAIAFISLACVMGAVYLAVQKPF